MGNSELLQTLANAGIDPAKTFVRSDGHVVTLAVGGRPEWRAPTASERQVLRNFGVPVVDPPEEVGLTDAVTGKEVRAIDFLIPAALLFGLITIAVAESPKR